ncbi:MAG: hypothetical protein K0R31_1716 [Clostridiales bacterium]|jgi:multidrug efflux pump subunit AcrA (membrane-fusion protein)|nr:hypothetical protein [Clostridiales bacterium]
MEYANYTALNNKLALSKKKKVLITTITVITSLAIVVTGVLTAYQYSLPQVKTKVARSGSLDTTLEAVGEIKIDKQLQDILKTEKITAQGDWKIKEIKVTHDDPAVPGTVLALIDLEDINMQIKKKELEINKAKIEIERRINDNSKMNNLEILQNEARQALNEVKKLEVDVKNRRVLFNSGAESSYNLQLVERSLDQANINYENKIKLAEIRKNEIDRANIDNDLNIKQLNNDIELKKTEMELLNSSIPSNGEIRSGFEGKVKSIYVVPGLDVSQGKVLFEIEKGETQNEKSVIQWKLDSTKGALLNEGDEIFIETRVTGEKRITESVKTKKYQSYDTTYLFTCPLSNSGQYQNGQQVRVYKVNKSVPYEKVIQKESVVKTEENKGYIYLLKNADGDSNGGKVVQKVNIIIKEANEVEYAVIGDFGLEDKIVTYSSKKLSNGMRVRT